MVCFCWITSKLWSQNIESTENTEAQIHRNTYQTLSSVKMHKYNKKVLHLVRRLISSLLAPLISVLLRPVSG